MLSGCAGGPKCFRWRSLQCSSSPMPCFFSCCFGPRSNSLASIPKPATVANSGDVVANVHPYPGFAAMWSAGDRLHLRIQSGSPLDRRINGRVGGFNETWLSASSRHASTWCAATAAFEYCDRVLGSLPVAARCDQKPGMVILHLEPAAGSRRAGATQKRPTAAVPALERTRAGDTTTVGAAIAPASRRRTA
jgi:hypothetical protein